MLELTQAQLDRLAALEGVLYLDEVCRAALASHPAAHHHPGLRAGLDAAHQRALQLGLHDGPALTQFLFYEALAPSFHAHPAIDWWLQRPGAPIGERFDDLIAAQVAMTKAP